MEKTKRTERGHPIRQIGQAVKSDVALKKKTVVDHKMSKVEQEESPRIFTVSEPARSI